MTTPTFKQGTDYSTHCGKRRGASALGYGLLIGLIGVTALAAISNIGGQTSTLFDTVATSLPVGTSESPAPTEQTDFSTFVVDPLSTAFGDSVTITGNGETGWQVEATATDSNNATVSGTTTIASPWSITLDTSGLLAGQIDLSVVATDPSNASQSSAVTGSATRTQPVTAVTCSDFSMNNTHSGTAYGADWMTVESLLLPGEFLYFGVWSESNEDLSCTDGPNSITFEMVNQSNGGDRNATLRMMHTATGSNCQGIASNCNSSPNNPPNFAAARRASMDRICEELGYSNSIVLSGVGNSYNQLNWNGSAWSFASSESADDARELLCSN